MNLSVNRRLGTARVFQPAVCLLLTVALVAAQAPDPDVMHGWGTIAQGYRTPAVPSARLSNSSRLDSLIRDGKLYLSLQDAIALALENNLDIELQRYDLAIANTDIVRAKSGAFPRGVPLSIEEGPNGVGGPSVNASISGTGTLGGGDIPALNGVVGSGTETDLSILGSIPLATGPGVPQFDPTLTGTFGWNHTSDPQNSTFLPGLRSLNTNATEADVALQKGFVTGATASVGWDNLHQNTNSPLVTYNPSITSDMYVNLSQPLLRGFGPAVNNRYVRITRNNRQVSDLVFEQQVISTVAAVVRLYWDLVSLNRDVAVRSDALASAERLLRDNQASAEEGTRASIDVTRAQAEVARRRRDLAVSKTLVRQQSEVLKDYLTRSVNDNRLTDLPLVPTDSVQVPPQKTLPPVGELLEQAFRNRPELAQLRLQLANSQLSLKGSKSALLPELDLVASASNNALIGDPNPLANDPTLTGGTTNPSSIVRDPLFLGGYGDALAQLAHRNFPDYGVGVQLSIPLANRAARADVARDLLQLRQQEIRLRQLEKRVKLEITNASIAVEEGRASYEAAVHERILQQQTVHAEVEKLEVGASTSYLVIQYQGDLAQAQSAEISAQSDYIKAETALQRALGTLLDTNHVILSNVKSEGTR
ncbi:MAG TPA: TolC family protein [Bryobacteraceae bacterium]|nr:TolC family protein [Bryobacteraceae bacterium]